MALNTKQALRLLSEDESNYIHHNSLGHSTIYDSSGDELGKVSGTVFNRLLRYFNSCNEPLNCNQNE